MKIELDDYDRKELLQLIVKKISKWNVVSKAVDRAIYKINRISDKEFNEMLERVMKKVVRMDFIKKLLVEKEQAKIQVYKEMKAQMKVWKEELRKRQ